MRGREGVREGITKEGRGGDRREGERERGRKGERGGMRYGG